MAALLPPEAIKVHRGPLAAGGFATPAAADQDKDGDQDIAIGGEYGQLTYFENTGDSEDPLFAYRGEIRSGDNVPRAPGAHFQVADEYWGYTSPIVVDWDGDGKDDLIVAESRKERVEGQTNYMAGKREKRPNSDRSRELPLSLSGYWQEGQACL